MAEASLQYIVIEYSIFDLANKGNYAHINQQKNEIWQ
jgi:hypothetical protein